MNVYFTVDVESSTGRGPEDPHAECVAAARHVFCRIGGKEYGIPLQVRIMKEFGFRGTFFVETLATRCLGEADTRSIFDYLLEEGQDVQLHAHPIFAFWAESRRARSLGMDATIPQAGDRLGHYPEDLQMRLLTESMQWFQKFTGTKPKVFRAGGFAGSRSMLRCLRKAGILVDSSYNPCYHPELSFPDGAPLANIPQQIGGVWEIPITVARTKLPETGNGFKFADCTSLSFAEIRAMLEAGSAQGQRHFVMLFHSFSSVKARDVEYKEIRPNRIVIRRLEQMFRYLAENTDRYNVEVLGTLGGQLQAQETGRHFVADLGLVQSAVRKGVQLLNYPYLV